MAFKTRLELGIGVKIPETAPSATFGRPYSLQRPPQLKPSGLTRPAYRLACVDVAAAAPTPVACRCGWRRPGERSSTRRGSGVCAAAYGRGGSSSSSSDPNYYELLGVDPDSDEDDIRVAFRRRAKELHPDLNKEEGATEAFVQLSRAYEVLSDPEARRQYDMTHRTRRLNFFRDVEEEDDRFGRGGSPFRWSDVGHRGGGGGLRPDDDEEEEEEDDGDGSGAGDEEGGGLGSAGGDGDDEQGPGWQRRRGEEAFLEELAKYMSGPGSLRAWQSGRLDPWGTSTSDAWFRQVERQTRSPYGPSRQGYGTSRDDDDADGYPGGGEWDPSRGRVPGWTPPGRGSEWSHPRRQWDEEDRRGGGPGRQGGGGGDFRRPFKI